MLTKASLSKNKIVKSIASAYINILRCTPSIVLLFIVFYGLPELFKQLFNLNIYFWSKSFFVVTALSLLYASSMSEIFRSAYLAVGKDQFDAALSIGLSPFQAITRIVAPQAVIYAIPNLGNSFISLLKEGSLAFTIGLIDVMGAGNLFISRNYGGYALETYISLTVIYWGITIILEKTFHLLELHFSKGRKNA